MNKVILQGRDIPEVVAQRIAESITATVEKKSKYYELSTHVAVNREALHRMGMGMQIDVNLIPAGFAGDNTKLFVMDMDSSLINIECIDEIGDFLGIKAEIAVITAATMGGEIDFVASLKQRVALLKGIDASVLEEVYQQRLQLNPGAEVLLEGLAQRGVKTALVSGGFSFFTNKLKERLGFDYTLANTLDIVDGKLTGHVKGEIVDGPAKLNFLLTISKQLGLALTQTIALGDGANDVPMLNQAGLGIAYRAKQSVQEQADCVFNYIDLSGVLGFLER